MSAFTGTLHPYQVDDVEEMKARGRMLVAYGQGTGKTVMTIACLEDLMATEEITEPGIIIALSSLKYQWRDRIDTFTGGQSVPLVIDGTPKQRAAQYAAARNWDADYVILSYENVVNDWSQVRKLPRGFLVADEVTFIKGFRAQRAKRAKRLQHGCEFVYGLTGTPIENGKPEEMFSIFQFVDDEVLGRWDIFDKAFIVRNGFGGVQRYRNIPTFHTTVSKAMVRRTRNDQDVSPYMPKFHRPDPLTVELDPAARKLYKHVAGELLDDLAEAALTMGSGFSLDRLYGVASGDDEANALRGRIGQKLLTLQWVCDHPQLLRLSAQRYEDVWAGKAASGGSAYVAELAANGHLDGLNKTPKLDLTARHLNEVLELDAANKIVVFTVYVDMVDLIAERFAKHGATAYTGRLNAKQKDASLKKFQTDPKCRVFVSSDAGGYGVDIPQANYLFNYDLPDKWGTGDQRNTRIDRASSEFTDIYVRDILVKGSSEERKHLALAQKGAVSNAFVDGRGINKKGGVDMTLGSLADWLRENEV